MKKTYRYLNLDTGKILKLPIIPPSTTVGRKYKLEIDGQGVLAVVYQGET